ncbi:MAG: long-chain fatty acid--CoA ligase [Desulfotomaculaceae bacterium]|nr:long-chain fatty acid--CoA ligase [Desulfotomaculaceae bacterium]
MRVFELHKRNAPYTQRTALRFHGETITYADLEHNVEQFARYFKKLGLSPGDRAAIALPNCPEFIYSYMGITRAGGIVVPLNLLQAPRELAFMLQDSGSHFLILNPAIGQHLCQLPLPALTIVILDDKCRKEIAAVPQVSFPEVNDLSTCTFLYTSGTTGHPKAAMLTHANLIANVKAMEAVSGFSSEDNFLAVLPMFHSFGWATSVLFPLYLGGAITILDSFKPKEILQVLVDEGVTIFCGVPSMFSLLLKSRNQVVFPKLKFAFSGGDSIFGENLVDFEKKFNTPIVEGYGLSEASPIVCLNPIHGTRKISSVGVPLPGVEAKVVDEEGQEMPCGEIGELIARGPNIMQGYFNREEETLSALQGGWLHTGDLAYQDQDGFLFIVGRKKELIINAGFNVYPREVELALEEHPGVAEAAVIGVAHPLKGQVVKAFILHEEGHEPDKQELFYFLKGRLAGYKLPETFVFTSALPRGASGKILKRLLE